MVNLQLMDASDIEQVREWRNSKEVAEFMLSRTIITKEQQENWYNSIKDDPACIYWIIVMKNGQKIGLASLTKIDRENHHAEPGLYIGIKEQRNSFAGMEAYYLLLNYGFEQLQLDKVYGTVLSNNTTAIKMNTSFGYTKEKTLKDELTIDDVCYDVDKVVLYRQGFYKSKMASFFCRKIK